MAPPAGGGEHRLVADPQRIRIAHLEHRQVEPAERLHQPEPALLIVGERMAEDGPPAAVVIQMVSASVIRYPMVAINPLSRMTTPLPARSVPSVSAV